MRLFALHTSNSFGEKVAMALNVSLNDHEERDFEDGEHKIRPLVSVRDQDVYVIHSLHADGHESVNDKLIKLLFFISTLKDAGAARITAIVPYLCYARKDRRTKARDPLSLKYVASLFESSGLDRLVTIDVHNLQAFQNAFRCHTEHLEAQNLFMGYFKSMLDQDEELVVMSPDIGGVKRAEQFRDKMAEIISKPVGFAFMEKMRSKDVVSGELVVGNVKDKAVILLDDLISSGTTMARAAVACVRLGATSVYAVATHGAFISGANAALKEKAIKKVIVTNTIPPGRLNEELAKKKLEVLDITSFFAETIRRLHTGGSLVSLMKME
ncbi:ribose-phosphate diphosphokinase [Cyclobacterium jeungdonense]|uniref:ribose-phosphate diphosphokinase n=1 Tax=Cyclobacterium jeungdonense TaxID=708087 RepID=A0ABT8CBK3_9BACT|nr:ribose-phosphate pyrophosphokinase [Cyclobacterium jeungdonense]MDN3690169.1 ribose-phosphate pyrophosphokinase [Cyclobacterium jeungdonense]